MKLVAASEAQQHLPALARSACSEPIGLMDEDGKLVGLPVGLDEDDVVELLVRTAGFQAMIERSRASLETEDPISAEEPWRELRPAATKMKRGTGAK